jgi:hypothetical protein
MLDSEHLVLSDRNSKPDEGLLSSVIGDNMIHWLELMEHMQKKYPGASGDWNYYNDGKQWLYKMTWKKKTIFWIVLVEGSFRVTFYFGDKAEEKIFSADIPRKVKDDFRTGKRYGKIRAISITINDITDVETVKTVAEIRAGMK